MAEKTSQSCNADDCYRHPAVRPPTLGRLAEIAKSLQLDLTDEELNQYKDAVAGFLGNYQTLYDLPEPKLPVKYPRTPGYRPSQQENPLNAWYWRCDIQGASNGKLHGKTIAIKDSIPVAGVPMMNGSQILEGFIPDIDATVVTRCLDHGARILGKSTCENLCFSGASFTSATGNVKNPANPNRMAGGSTSGSAALIANNDVDMALGGDQGGSIRIPAATCGIVGLKPTFGLVPYTGISIMESTLDHTGPMARTVYDVALLLETIAGFDGMDPRQPNGLTTPEYTKQLNGNIKGLRVGLVKEGFSPENEADVNEMVRQSAERLRDIGAVVEEVSLPWHSKAGCIFMPLIVEGMFAGSGVADTSGLMYYDTNMRLAFARGLKLHSKDGSVSLNAVRLLARYMTEDYHGMFYSKAQNIRRDLKKAYDEVLEKYDVVIMPTCSQKAPIFPSPNDTIAEMNKKAFESAKHTSATNVTGHPAITINAGFSQGLPVGMMIIGRMFDESTVLNVAYAYEQLRDNKK